MTVASNLLTFFALAITLLLVWRRSWPGRLRLFVAQSVLLALLAAVVGMLAGKRELVVVALVFLALKGWIIPRVLARMASGTPARSGVAPGQSSGIALLAAGTLVVAAYVIILPVTASATLPTAPRSLRSPQWLQTPHAPGAAAGCGSSTARERPAPRAAAWRRCPASFPASPRSY